MEFQLSAEESAAVIDSTGKYRYLLTRRWDASAPTCLFIMLNPSTADAQQDDPTICKCIGFAKRWGFGALEVVNLYAWRSPYPITLKECEDPIGPENDKYILQATATARLIIAAWGSSLPDFKRADAVLRLLADNMIFVGCLGVNKDGQPKHPLYLPSLTPPQQYMPEGASFTHEGKPA